MGREILLVPALPLPSLSTTNSGTPTFGPGENGAYIVGILTGVGGHVIN